MIPSDAQVDDLGIAATNDPRVSVLWERRDAIIDLTFQIEPEPQAVIAFRLPPSAWEGGR
jgi:hypothetical protein